MLQEVSMAKTKKAKRAEIPTARPKTQRMMVSSPTVPGFREEVDYVPGSVDHMRARKQFGKTRAENEFAFRAADRVRRAHETLHGAVGGAMDFDRVRGRGASPMGPHETYLQAAETMGEIKRVLYPLDHRVVELVVCHGMTIEKAAEIIRRRTPTRSDKEDIGRSLRQGLAQLADRWFGSSQKNARSEIESWRDPHAQHTEAVPGVIDPGKTVHATGRKVFRK